MKRPEALVGRRLAGKYQLEALIGKGGFGAVFRATHHPIGRTVAVKINLHGHREDLHARFVREAQVQAELRHPGCAMLLDFGEDDDLFYMVQEYVAGRSLKEALTADGPLAPGRAVAIICKVLDALAAAHELGIVHRDIKPANIMLTVDRAGGEDVRVLDFGIAKVLTADDDQNLTGSGMTLGTPAFMAPEQIRNLGVGPPADVYATGAMLYRLIAGGGPFEAEATIDLLRLHLEAPPPPLPAGPAVLDPIIARAMEKHPDDRYPTAAEMQAALAPLEPGLRGLPAAGVAVDGPAHALESGTTALSGGVVLDRPPERASRRRWWALGLGVATAIAVAVLAGRSADEAESAGAADGVDPIAQPAIHAMSDTDAFADAGRNAIDSIPDAIPDAIADATADATADAEVDAPIVGDIALLPPLAPDAGRPARPERPRPSRPKPPPAPVEPRPKPTPAALRRAFDEAIAACDCAAAQRAYEGIEAIDPPQASGLESRHVEACVMFTPDNCNGRKGRTGRNRQGSRP